MSGISPDPDSDLAPWPFFADDEIAAATAVLRSGRVNYWTGEEARTFEREYAAHCGVTYGLAVANGTLALELALHGLGIGPGDDVIVPARTFVATASAVARCGARPVVADIDPVSQTLTAETVALALTPRTKAVIPVHLAGWPTDMAPLMAVARAKGLKLIEDCAQAHGAAIDGRPVGGLGDVGCFSFCQDKIISTGGEGGMVVTNDETAYRRMWAMRDHGKDFARTTTPGGGIAFKWLADSFGSNFRLTESQAAIGRVQLTKLEQWVARRRENARVLDDALGDLNAVSVARPPSRLHHAYYKYYFMVTPSALKDGWSRDKICAVLDERGVPARSGICPDITLEQAFANAGPQPDHPGARAIAERTVMLPVHPTLTTANMAFMARETRAVVLAATR